MASFGYYALHAFICLKLIACFLFMPRFVQIYHNAYIALIYGVEILPTTNHCHMAVSIYILV